MIKLVTDPYNKEKYIKLTKHVIIATILITLSLTLVEIPKNYFGSTAEITDGKIAEVTIDKIEDKDCQDREVVNIDGKRYVVTDSDVELNTMGLCITKADRRAVNINTMKHCSVLRTFSECQGTFKGYFAQIKYFRDSDGFIFPYGTKYSEYIELKKDWLPRGFGGSNSNQSGGGIGDR